MSERRRYRKKADRSVTAVRVDLETEGFVYQKWGAEQRCKAGDWLVCNAGDTYTIDHEVFERTYRKLSPGSFVKTTPIWAEMAAQAGSVETAEGRSHYQTGDFLVSNQEDGGDAYCISAAKFATLYELDD